jgi:CheY-like chemotaxis protein
MNSAKIARIVEDDESIRDVIVIALRAEGFEVRVASNGLHGLEEIERQRPDVILLDMLMPVMHGWQLHNRYVLMPGPYAPIIVLTAAPDAASRAAEVSADDYIAKPFDPKNLIGLVRHYASLPPGDAARPSPTP